MQDKAGGGGADLSPASPQNNDSIDAGGSSLGRASRLAQPSKSMALSNAALAFDMTAELDSLAAESPGAASASEGRTDVPATPEAGTSHDKSTINAQHKPTLQSMSSESLSALPTPTHPSAVPAAAAQELNNALGRSLLQAPHVTQGAAVAAASPHSQRLTSAYSGTINIQELKLHEQCELAWHLIGIPNVPSPLSTLMCALCSGSADTYL